MSFFVFLFTNCLIEKINNNDTINTKEIQEKIETQEAENKIKTIELQQTGEVKQTEKWQIEIPAISLIAPIAEGTEIETLNKYVGHFKMTPKTEGNIGLAAHNRGYPVNYFKDLKNLKYGDEIIYTYEQTTKIYKVISNIQISDIDWSYLENTSQNTLTLITCIENKPEYRRCVQAIESEVE